MRSGVAVVAVLLLATLERSDCSGSHAAHVKPSFRRLRGGRKAAPVVETPKATQKSHESSLLSSQVLQTATCIGIVGVWLSIATVYYAKHENWPYAQSLFYAVDTGMSIGFGAVAEELSSTKLFTIIHVLLGASAVGGAIALFAESAIAGSSAIASAEYTIASVRAAFEQADADNSGSLSPSEFETVLKKCGMILSPSESALAMTVFDPDGSGFITIDEFIDAVGHYVDGDTPVEEAVKAAVRDKSAPLVVRVLKSIGKVLNDNRIIALWFVWIVGGAIWGMKTEGWDLVTGLYFAVGALATGGLQGPALNAAGTIPDRQAAFVAIYCLTGIPIFAMALGQFANLFIHHHLVSSERASLQKPISVDEFEFAQTLFISDGKIDMAEFMALELLRLGKVDTGTLTTIKNEFDRLDKDGDGHLKMSEIATSS